MLCKNHGNYDWSVGSSIGGGDSSSHGGGGGGGSGSSFGGVIIIVVVVIVVIIIIFFMQGIYTYILKQTVFLGNQCCSYSVVTVHGAYNTNTSVKSSFTLVLSKVCVVCPTCLFSVVP